MNSSSLQSIVQRYFLVAVVLGITTVAWGGRTPQKPEPEHKSAPSKPAARHPAPEHKSAPHKSSSRPPSFHSPAHRPPASHPASAHKSNPNKPATHAAPAKRADEREGGREPRPAAEHGEAERPREGEHTERAEHSPAGERKFTPEHAPMARNVTLKGGGRASIRPTGQIRSVDREGMHIEHGVHSERTVVSEHNGVRVVSTGRSSGYVQRSYVTVGGHSYYSRTYYAQGSYHTAVYRSYSWGGHAYYAFHAGFWFHPAFYGWGIRPWGAPVYWGVGAWGWGGAPWWGFYGGWFTPYPYYSSPAYWLTDYVIAANLQAAYAARQAAATNAEADAIAADAALASAGGGTASASASSTVTLSPEVKEAIADEVKAQLAAQQAEAAQSGSGAQVAASVSVNPAVKNGATDDAAPASGDAPAAQTEPAPATAPSKEEVPPALDPARRTFVVDSNLSVAANGQECGLTGGDVLTRLSDTPDANNMVSASVSASKKADCAAGLTVSVKVDDLQEMQNHFDEQVDNGLKELAKKQGSDGMPKAPDTNVVESDIPAPKPDTTAEKTLQDQQQAADQAETQVKQEAAAPDSEPGKAVPSGDNHN